jgi:hypothetical protein
MSAYTIATFMAEVRFNTPPVFDSFSYLAANEMWAYQKWNVTAKFLMDSENNDPIMDAKVVTWDSTNSVWVVGTQPASFRVITSVMGDLYIEFVQPTQPAGGLNTQVYNI